MFCGDITCELARHIWRYNFHSWCYYWSFLLATKQRRKVIASQYQLIWIGFLLLSPNFFLRFRKQFNITQYAIQNVANGSVFRWRRVLSLNALGYVMLTMESRKSVIYGFHWGRLVASIVTKYSIFTFVVLSNVEHDFKHQQEKQEKCSLPASKSSCSVTKSIMAMEMTLLSWCHWSDTRNTHSQCFHSSFLVCKTSTHNYCALFLSAFVAINLYKSRA